MTRPDPKVLFRITVNHLPVLYVPLSEQTTCQPGDKPTEIRRPREGDIIEIVSVDLSKPHQRVKSWALSHMVDHIPTVSETARIIDCFESTDACCNDQPPRLQFCGIAEYVDCSENPLFKASKIW